MDMDLDRALFSRLLGGAADRDLDHRQGVGWKESYRSDAPQSRFGSGIATLLRPSAAITRTRESAQVLAGSEVVSGDGTNDVCGANDWKEEAT
jgi:hypothetical protein